MMRGAVIGGSAVSVVDSMSICMLFSVILCCSLLFSVVLCCSIILFLFWIGDHSRTKRTRGQAGT